MIYTLTWFCFILLIYVKLYMKTREFDRFHDLMKTIKSYLLTQGYIDFFTAHSLHMHKHHVEFWEPVNWFRDDSFKIFAVTPNHQVHLLIVYFNKNTLSVDNHDILNTQPFEEDSMYENNTVVTNGFFTK